jgi:hypothetical protein
MHVCERPELFIDFETVTIDRLTQANFLRASFRAVQKPIHPRIDFTPDAVDLIPDRGVHGEQHASRLRSPETVTRHKR